MNDNYRIKSCAFLLVVLFSGSLYAQDKFNTDAGNFFDLELTGEFGSLDNFFYDENDEQSSAYYVLTPEISMQTQFDRQLFTLAASTSHVKYGAYSLDDHSDFALSPSYQFKIAENKAFYLLRLILFFQY